MIVIAIYHLSVKSISRRTGRSSVAAAAYRAGERIENEYDGVTHDYSKKTSVTYSEIILPENAPQEFQNRAVLWNAVELSEKRNDARTSREIEIALPSELNLQEQIAVIREYVKENFVNKGMCADVSFHSGHKHKRGEEDESRHDENIETRNPHVHIMLTVRPVNEKGFTKNKTSVRDWNDRENVPKWRESWAKVCNKEFERKGLDVRIDHRSLEDQGKEERPTIHLGAAAYAMEKRGIKTERGDYNREVAEENEIKKTIAALNHDIDQLQAQLDEANQQEQTADQQGHDIQEITAKNRELTNKLRHLKADSEDIGEYQKAIDGNERKFEQLTAELEKSRDEKERRNIERVISSIRYSKEQAEQGLMRKYGIAKDQIAARQEELAEEMRTTAQEQGKFAFILREVQAREKLENKDRPDQTIDRDLEKETLTRAR